MDDRIEIARLLGLGFSKAEIARRIGVHRSTITRETARVSWQPEHDHANLRPYLRNGLDTRGPHDRLYLGRQAQLQADARAIRSHQPHRMEHDRLVTASIAERVESAGMLDEDTHRRALRTRIETYIAAHLSDPDLTVAGIAVVHHISVRYLQKLFEQQHETVSGWIRHRRHRRHRTLKRHSAHDAHACVPCAHRCGNDLSPTPRGA